MHINDTIDMLEHKRRPTTLNLLLNTVDISVLVEWFRSSYTVFNRNNSTRTARNTRTRLQRTKCAAGLLISPLHLVVLLIVIAKM